MATIERQPPPDTVPSAFPIREFLQNLWQSYTLRIILQGAFTAWAAISLTFILIRALPGNPVELHIEQLLNQGYTIEQARNQAAGLFNYDPDQPIQEQYIVYMGDLLQGDLGQSITSSGTPVRDQILRFLPWTLVSLGSALLISIVVGTAIGMAMAYWRGTPFDNSMTNLASVL
ncbi:MAG: ABC transporter permease, partial [Anaerolineales bacterium]